MSTPHKATSLLLIDDDIISREVMAMTLEMNGFHLSSAEGGERALSLLSSGSANPDVILMDSQMPGLSGIALVEALRKATQARIVAISGSPVSKQLLHATDGFLLKPVDPEALKSLLNSATIDVQAAAEPTPPPDTFLDQVTFNKLKAMMSAKALRELYVAVAADLKTRLCFLESAMNAGDQTEVARIAHAIKGGCAMVGLTGAREIASELEKGNLHESWDAKITQLRSTLLSLEGMITSSFPS